MRSVDVRSPAFVFGLIVALFFANDIAFLAAVTPAQVYYADYGFKLAAIAGIMAIPALRTAALKREVSLRKPAVIIATVSAAVVGYAVAEAIDQAVDRWTAATVLFRFPHITDPSFRWFDLTAGLALTAVVEELVFRKLFHALFAERFGVVGVVVASSVLFGLIHWSSGVGTMLTSCVIGVVFMMTMQRTGSALAVIVAHYLINFAIFY